MHLQPYFEKYDYIGSNISETIYKNGLSVPSDTKLTDEQQDRIIKVIKDLFN